jgi:hypothetical protein
MAKKVKPELFSQEYQKQWSEKHKYKHIHTGEHCTFEAYVAELIVLRRSEKLNLGKPAYKFWTKGDPLHWLWKKQYGAACKLRKKYSEEAILSAINSPDFKNLLVIGVQDGRSYKINPLAEKAIAKHQAIIDDAKNKPVVNLEVEQEKVEVEVRQTQSYNTISKQSIHKLRNL